MVGYKTNKINEITKNPPASGLSVPLRGGSGLKGRSLLLDDTDEEFERYAFPNRLYDRSDTVNIGAVQGKRHLIGDRQTYSICQELLNCHISQRRECATALFHELFEPSTIG